MLGGGRGRSTEGGIGGDCNRILTLSLQEVAEIMRMTRGRAKKRWNRAFLSTKKKCSVADVVKASRIHAQATAMMA